MSIELKIPDVGESITEVQVGEWLKGPGDDVSAEDGVVEIETDKISFELPAPATGKITEILKKRGEPASVGEVIGYMEENAAASGKKKAPEADSDAESKAKDDVEEDAEADAESKEKAPEEKDDGEEEDAADAESKAKTPKKKDGGKEEAEADAESKAKAPEEKDDGEEDAEADVESKEKPASSAKRQGPTGGHVMPASRRVLDERGIDPAGVEGTGPGGRVTKEDAKKARPAKKQAERESADESASESASVDGVEEVVPMSPLRKTIARRLVEAQQTAALLTTFNEIDMSAVIDARARYQEQFQKRHGVKLGFMSFFVKAAVDALRLVPQVNARVEDDNIVYRNRYDIGIAIGGGKGLVVPVLMEAERLGFAEIELKIADFAERAKKSRLTLRELSGGSFTISNGGIYGSMLSTPIVNPPQSGILGLHAINERPIGRNGEIVLAPMMYVALTYDHRIVDGREAVTFLKRIKEVVEDPSRMLLEI